MNYICHTDDTRETALSTESFQGQYGIPVPTAQYLSSKEAHSWDGFNTSVQKQSLIFFSSYCRSNKCLDFSNGKLNQLLTKAQTEIMSQTGEKKVWHSSTLFFSPIQNKKKKKMRNGYFYLFFLLLFCNFLKLQEALKLHSSKRKKKEETKSQILSISFKEER